MKHTDNELQAAIDAAMIEIGKQVSGPAFAACPKAFSFDWPAEATARLALAKAFLAKLPEQPSSPRGNYTDEEISSAWKSTNLDHPNLNPFSSGWIRAFLAKLDHFVDLTEKVPQLVLADDGRSLGQVAKEAFIGAPGLTDDWMNAAAQAVANVVLAQAVRRMEAVHWRELKHVSYENIRARLIAAARGEAVGVNGLTEAEEAQTASVAGLSKTESIETPAQTVNEKPKQQVPLGPDDVMPGSVFRCDNDHWFQVLYASSIGVCFNNVGLPMQYRWTELTERWQINRSIPLTGKWDANAWEPCYKLI